MRAKNMSKMIRTAAIAIGTLLFGISGALAQSVNLTAAAANASLPDGQSVPMWGYSCGAVSGTGVSCAALNPNANGGWSPVVITVPTGTNLTINLTNNLPVPPGAQAGIPTSLVIVGQLGGGLGDKNQRTTTPSPGHQTLSTSWPIAGDSTGPQFTPPPQAPRVQSFATEVATSATKPLQWSALRPGTYLIESGTHPSIQGPMGLYGVLVVTNAPTTASRGVAYQTGNQSVQYDAEVPLLLSEIDPVQNKAVALAVSTSGFSETAVWSGVAGACGDPAVHTCYPPAVNYDARYYLVNGVAFDKSDSSASPKSLFSTIPANPTAGTGQVLVRFVNAGLRMHIPAIVGAQTNGTLADGTTGVVPGFALIAEDGNLLPDVTYAVAKNKPIGARVQNEVFLPPGKTYDVMINAPAANAKALPVFDRELSLSTNNAHDGGMQAYISVNGSGMPVAGANAVAVPDSYFLVPGSTLTVSDPGKGVIANDRGVYGVAVLTAPTGGTLTLNANGTFTYVPNSGTTADSFVYQANGAAGPTAKVTLSACSGSCLGGAPTANADAYTSNVATYLHIAPPGVLENDNDPDKHPLTAVLDNACTAPANATLLTSGQLKLNADGSFTASQVSAGSYYFCYHALNSQNTQSNSTAAQITFLPGSGLNVQVFDAPEYKKGNQVGITDYRWIIEEDRTLQIDPSQQVNTGGQNVPSLGTNFHTSYMPVVAQGCVGQYSCEEGQTVLDPTNGTHAPAVCDIGNGICRTDAIQQTAVTPADVHLDPTKHYYISILPGDGANPFNAGAGAPVDLGNGKSRPFSIAQDCPSGPGGADFAPGSGTCGHTMGGAPVAPGENAVNVLLQETPLATAKIAVFVFEDDWPLNGENDAGGGVDTLATQEPGLGGFQIRLLDQAGGFGDSTGQITYDMFNMPVTNSLAGTIDQRTGFDACPITKNPDGLVGVITTCPHFESDGKTQSPLEGQAVIENLYPGLYEVWATPGADRIARGEEWLQTNTLDGTQPQEAFIKVGEPAYFQEFGPAGYHVMIGFANPAIINSRHNDVCANTACNNKVAGQVTMARISRSPDERIYSSGSYDAYAYTQCYASIGDPDAEDFAFAKCNADGTFSFDNIPDGNWRITVFDQWNDILVDGLSTPIGLSAGNTPKTTNIEIPMQQWRTNLATRTFLDLDGNGVSDPDNEPGLPLVPTNVRFRDGSYSNFNNTDLNGYAGFNEIFPYFAWVVLEADTTRYKQTGVHVVYDAGGPADGHGGGSSNVGAGLLNSNETYHVPNALRVPGARYCANADCPTGDPGFDGDSPNSPGSTGRVDPPWVTTEAWQGYIGNYEIVEFGKKPFAAGENGGIRGHVVYASTRPFDDPALLLQLSWEPLVPHVTINLYQEGTAPDGSKSLKLVDSTKTSSWDDWAQGFRSDGVPNMNCPGQDPTSQFMFTLNGSTNWLSPDTKLPNNSQFKCYDGMHSFNQVQPAPYDGLYQFPSIIDRNPQTGAPQGTGSLNGVSGSMTGTNCTICVPNPTDGTPMLPAGKYVVEVVVPPGYELVKEEDKNILIGDNYIAPVTQQFGGLGSIFILPDQAEVAAYNPNNPQNATNNLGATPRHEGDTGSVESFWPCVGQPRVVPDYISLFPHSAEVAPFAGATRNLCDRKEVTLEDQASALAKFYIFSSTHVAAHFTGIITDDFASEFDPFSPAFGEKFAIPNLPVSFKDFNGNEVARFYSDQWGFFDGLNYSTWEVNPPNPTGYAPQVMMTCMNDPGPIPGPNGTMITDPYYNPSYSNFCYEWSYMPGQTAYMDTPVIPTAAFAEGYNPVDCSYPDATPAIASVTGDPIPGGGAGPWVSAAGHQITIKALGDQQVPNNAYSGPSATTAPYNQKFITRHYGFGSTAGTVALAVDSKNSNGTKRTYYPLTGVQWSDMQITGNVPAGLPNCKVQQRAKYAPGATSTQCGELVITTAPSTTYPHGQQSVDTVTVTVGGKVPTYVNGESPTNDAIQKALDAASPGDLVIVGPGYYPEMLLMWKPVRLQGVAAASVTINANTHPAGKMDPWRHRVACLFGVSLDGGMISNSNPFDPSNPQSTECPASMQRQVDAIPLEPIVGWDPTLNGNLAELLQEPTLMGAYEGAGITVLAKGVRDVDVQPGPGVNLQPDPNCNANGICVPLTASNADCNTYPSNYNCNPSRVDGIGFTNSSGGGGGVFLHGWNHNTEVSNNRIFANTGTLSGGITVGQMEVPDAIIVGTQQQAFGYNNNTYIHNNYIARNSSIGDELNSSTPEAAGGVTFCSGADNYLFDYNWVCGNLSGGDGGGFAHFGMSYNGTITNNSFLFNQSFNPTIPTYGGGVSIMGMPPDGTVCETNQTVDIDCPPQLTDGIGPGLVIDSNLILGNSAEGGSGGGLRLQGVNGTEISRNPGNPGRWYSVRVTNNIIANNVAGWDGGGVSLQDALNIQFINNTVVGNDTTASSGVLFNTLGAADGNVPPPAAGSTNGSNCTPQPDPSQPQDPSCVNPVTTSTPQVAGLVSIRNTPNLMASLPNTVLCPSNYPNPKVNGICRQVSYPSLENNLFWHNRTFNITVPGAGSGLLNQQNLVTLVPQLNQASTGDCPTTGPNGGQGPAYWDIGIRGDTAPNNHQSGFTLNPRFSILSDPGDYPSGNNIGNPNAGLTRQYCNGARIPPENGGLGFNTPPGIADATLPNPVFNLTPAATVDEGNNWINLSYGPLSLLGPNGALLGDYSITASSSAIDTGTNGNSTFGFAPPTDFFGTARPSGGVDIGAVEFTGTATAPAVSLAAGTTNTFPQTVVGVATVNAPTLDFLLRNSGPGTFTISTITVGAAPFSRVTVGSFPVAPNCGTTLAAGSTCTIRVRFQPTASGTFNGSVTVNGTGPGNASVSVTGSPLAISGTAVRAITFSLQSASSPSIQLTVPDAGNPTLAFGTQTTTATATATLLLTNTSGGAINFTTQIGDTVTNAFTQGTRFAKGADSCQNTVVAAGSSCTIVVTFNQNNLTTHPARLGTLTVRDNAPGNPQIVNLTGN